ncbi:MAG TPA: hypothetical protein VK586_27520 [Streptosporangiaceae bacterium]|nr:hypothetical protein [Streptosporangiaceae bacterium]
MRYIIIGAGAIGGAIGARLTRSGSSRSTGPGAAAGDPGRA